MNDGAGNTRTGAVKTVSWENLRFYNVLTGLTPVPDTPKEKEQ